MALNTLEQGVFLLARATEEDNKKNYEEALHLYEQGLECLRHTMEYDVQKKKTKIIIHNKCLEYLVRIDILKEHLNLQKAFSESHIDDCDFRQKIKRALLGVVLVENPDVKWNEISGLEAAKEVLEKSVILPTKYPQKFEHDRVSRNSILLFGPPGTGKSYLVKAVATETKSICFSVLSSDLLLENQKESESLVKNLFKLARKHKPSIILIDDIDLLCSSISDRESKCESVRKEILEQMKDISKDTGILVFGATNTPWVLEINIRKIFEKFIYVSLPEKHARLEIFTEHLKSIRHELSRGNLLELTSKTESFTSADICNIARDALMQPIRRIQSATHFKLVSGPCPTDPQKMTDNLLTPCSPDDFGAIEMTWREVPSDKLCEPPVTMADMYKSLTKYKSTVNKTSLIEFDKFIKGFGLEGNI